MTSTEGMVGELNYVAPMHVLLDEIYIYILESRHPSTTTSPKDNLFVDSSFGKGLEIAPSMMRS